MKKSNKAFMIILLLELIVMYFIKRWLIPWIIIVALLCACYKIYRIWFYPEKEKRKSFFEKIKEKLLKKKRRIRKKTAKQYQDLENALLVHNTGTGKSAAFYVEDKEEYNIMERSLLGLPIALSEVDNMDGVYFEDLIFYRFKGLQYEVYTTATSGDYGADLLIETSTGTVAVQLKRFDYNRGRTVGVDAVQEVLGAIYYYDAARGLVITNSVFTDNAKKLARKVGNIILWDREDLKEKMGFE